MKENYSGCIQASTYLLEKTGHIPIVTNIAMGVGYCAYYAKLTEFIGVKSWMGYSVDRFSGKGKPVHQLMALTALDIFPGTLNVKNISELLKSNFKYIEVYGKKDSEEDVIQLAQKLFENLLSELPKLCDILGVSLENLIPIPEQQFVEFDLHMRGIPDLILEDAKNKKAIVIDWKTGPNPERIYSNEEAQVVAYSLIEGKRLYKDYQASEIRQLLTDKQGKISILPIIIRPTSNGVHSPNPIILNDSGKVSLEKYNKLISDVLLEAEYLTELLANSTRGGSIDTSKVCRTKFDWSETPQNAIVVLPNQLYKGQPRSQKKYPCVNQSTGKPICPVIKSCHFYYGRDFNKQEQYEKDMWKLRYNVLSKKEESLSSYKSIYNIFKYYSNPAFTTALAWISKGNGFQYSAGTMPTMIERPQIIYGSSSDPSSVSRLDPTEIMQESTDSSGFLFSASRKIRSNEREAFFVIPSGKTILISLMDTGWNPFLAVSLFANIQNVEIKEGRVEYQISVPSKVFRFQAEIFKRYIKKFKIDKNIFLIEVGADLTQIELSAIDALQELLSDSNAINAILQKVPTSDEFINEIKTERNLKWPGNEEAQEEDEDARDNVLVLSDVLKNYMVRSSRREK